MLDAYREEEVNGEARTVMALHSSIAPIKVGVLPLSKNEQLSPMAHGIAADIRPKYQIEYDEAGSIGKRYRRHEEIGTPYCVTVDFDSLEDHAVTVRDRDTMAQDRISTDKLGQYLAERLG